MAYSWRVRKTGPALPCRDQNLKPNVSLNVRGVVYAKRFSAKPNVGLFAQWTPSTGVVVNGLNDWYNVGLVTFVRTAVSTVWFCTLPPSANAALPPQPQSWN